MKKIFLSLLVSTISLLSFAQINPASERMPLIDAFLNSPEYSRVQIKVAALGNIDLTLSKVIYKDDDLNKPIINIAITNRGVATGLMEIIPLPTNSLSTLPQNDKYVMQLIDYSNYDLNIKTGIIKTYDLNYEGYLSSEISVNNSSIDNFNVYRIPNDIAARHPADTNGNGNVSFGECLGYMQAACNGSSTCATMCWLVNVGGIGTSIGGQCSISMGAACVYLSINY
jgi:hypothetical protein